MRILVASDMHVDFHAAPARPDDSEYDVAVIAGDWANGVSFLVAANEILDWLDTDKPVLYVPGNHEMYGRSVNSFYYGANAADFEYQNLKMLVPYARYMVDGVAFVGDIGWTDIDEEHARTIFGRMNDFREIREFAEDPWSYSHMHTAFLRSLVHGDVLVTHHGQSAASRHVKYENNVMNSVFYAENDHVVEDYKLHIHGHTHTFADVMMGDTRIVCNPRGYPGENDWRPYVVEY